MKCKYCGEEIEDGNEHSINIKATCCSKECTTKLIDKIAKAVGQEEIQSEQTESIMNKIRKLNTVAVICTIINLLIVLLFQIPHLLSS